MKDKATKLFEEAIERLNDANEELFRPEEDIVSYSVCKNSQYAIENFLKGYLLKNGIDPSDFNTIDTLYKRCVVVNKNFKNVDLSDIKCQVHNLNSKYCNEVSKVSKCFEAADNLDTFLRQEKIID